MRARLRARPVERTPDSPGSPRASGSSTWPASPIPARRSSGTSSGSSRKRAMRARFGTRGSAAFWRTGSAHVTRASPSVPSGRAVVERLPFPAEQQAEKLSGLHREAVRPSLGFPFRGTEMSQADRTAFAAPTEALYAAAGDVAGVRQLVDSSKSPLYAAFLRSLPTIDLRVVHIVRDPRATVYSHLRRGSFGYGETFKLSLWWLRSNARNREARPVQAFLTPGFDTRISSRILPGRSVTLTDALGLSRSRLPIEGRVARLSRKHIISGNRARGEIGAITLRNDSEWRSGLPPRMQAIARGTTLPLLSRYGYSDD